MNKTILIGHLGKKPEARDVNGTKVCAVSMATSEKYKDKEGQTQENTEWHNLVFWGKTAEIVARYCDKGSKLAIEGKNKTRQYTDRDGVKKNITEVVVTSFEFLGEPKNGYPGGRKQKEEPSPTPAQANSFPEDFVPSTDTDDLPF